MWHLTSSFKMQGSWIALIQNNKGLVEEILSPLLALCIVCLNLGFSIGGPWAKFGLPTLHVWPLMSSKTQMVLIWPLGITVFEFLNSLWPFLVHQEYHWEPLVYTIAFRAKKMFGCPPLPTLNSENGKKFFDCTKVYCTKCSVFQ